MESSGGGHSLHGSRATSGQDDTGADVAGKVGTGSSHSTGQCLVTVLAPSWWSFGSGLGSATLRQCLQPVAATMSRDGFSCLQGLRVVSPPVLGDWPGEKGMLNRTTECATFLSTLKPLEDPPGSWLLGQEDSEEGERVELHGTQ